MGNTRLNTVIVKAYDYRTRPFLNARLASTPFFFIAYGLPVSNSSFPSSYNPSLPLKKVNPSYDLTRGWCPGLYERIDGIKRYLMFTEKQQTMKVARTKHNKIDYITWKELWSVKMSPSNLQPHPSVEPQGSSTSIIFDLEKQQYSLL